MNKISFTIPIKDKTEDKKPVELTNEIKQTKQINEKNVNPIINNSTNYKKLAPNVYIFC
jgi:hypothetical protein